MYEICRLRRFNLVLFCRFSFFCVLRLLCAVLHASGDDASGPGGLLRPGPIPAGHCHAAESRFWIVCRLRRALFRTASRGRGFVVSPRRTGALRRRFPCRTGAQRRRLFSPITGAPVGERLARLIGLQWPLFKGTAKNTERELRNTERERKVGTEIWIGTLDA